jgi:epoxyqueuosine reductase
VPVTGTLTTEAVVAHARTLGFDLCGVAPAAGLPELARLHDWLARGHAGEMAYLHRSAHVRADIRQFLPTAQSVVVTATSYYVDPDGQVPASAEGPSVARYARGQDYHLVLQARLERLLAWMRDAAGAPFDAALFVDKHQVQERVFAYYAGLGYIGKHSLLIHRDHGSWVLLAGLATSLPLAPASRLVEDLCGACTLCLDACPTGAIVAPREVDARRCLSYLTIELEGPVPDAQRAGVGQHLFGCDVCQDVCPWNLAPLRTTDPAWQPAGGREAPDPRELWRRPDDALHGFVAGSALMRTPLSRLRRNLATAIGNAGDPAALDDLDRPGGGVRNAAHSADAPVVRDAVAWARRRLGAPADEPSDR